MAEITGDPRFEYLRRKASAQIGEEEQKQKAALQRRLAALGNAPGGAAIKAEQEIGQQAAKQRQAAEEEIGFQEIGEQQRLKEIEEGRQYQTKEREASQAFGASEAEKTRGFTTAEREALQRFQQGEAALGRQFTSQEREAGQKYATQERLGSQEFTAGQNKLQMAQQRKLAEAQLSLQKLGYSLDLQRLHNDEQYQAAALEQQKLSDQFNAVTALAVQEDISLTEAAQRLGLNLKKLTKALNSGSKELAPSKGQNEQIVRPTTVLPVAY